MTQQKSCILDCTLRDGGYYTNWDYSEELLKHYFQAVNNLPIDYVEIGYLNSRISNNIYHGAFYYLPSFILEFCKAHCEKKLAVMLDVKKTSMKQLDDALKRIAPDTIALVRLAVKPEDFQQACKLAIRIKSYGFEVAFNLMYASKWNEECYENLQSLPEEIDYFYIVDSYGSLYPDEIPLMLQKIKAKTSVKIGFHGHNNLELALSNSLTSWTKGAAIIDSTILGMGRGAGNLKTELWLSILHSKASLNVDFDTLFSVCSEFEKLKNEFKWGTNLPYIVSGIRSLPQDTVSSQVRKRYFSLNSEVVENISFPQVNSEDFKNKSVLLVGGGKTAMMHSEAINQFLNQNKACIIVFASSRNVPSIQARDNLKFHFLAGNEGKRLENVVEGKFPSNSFGLNAPKYFQTQNHIPEGLRTTTYDLPFHFDESFGRSITAIIFQLSELFEFKDLIITGYDGYGIHSTQEETELFYENQRIFDQYLKREFYSITPTQYDMPQKSVYSLI